jgi:hypothetical protein
MRAIDVKCPHCGAALRVDADADGAGLQRQIDCAYCGTRSWLQLPEQVPAPQLEVQDHRAAAEAEAIEAATEAAAAYREAMAARREPSPRRHGLTSALVPMAILGAVLGFVLFRKRAIETRMQWQGTGGAILHDLDGDGAPEVIGRVRYVLQDDRVALAAFDGKSGKKRWESPALGSYGDTYQGRLALVGNTLIYGSPLGGLRAFGVADGKLRWQAPLAEEVKEICAMPDGTARVTTTDGVGHAVRLSDGVATEAEAAPGPRPDGCTRVAHDGDGGDPAIRVEATHAFDIKVPGMRPSRLIERSGGARIALGSRDKGTAAPMAARLAEDPAQRWATELAERPLESSSFAPEHAALGDGQLFVVFGMRDSQKPAHLVALDLARGTRLWEVPLAGTSPVEGVLAAADRVYVSSWGQLEAFDPATGQRLYAIGERW